MPWCPKCGIEYRDGFDTCSDCGCGLSKDPVLSVTEADPGSETESETETESEPEYGRGAFLTSTDNSIEADMIEVLLNANDIPVLKKYGEAGDYLKIFMGTVNSAVDLFVPSQLLDKAKEIMEANQGTFGDAVIPEEELEAQALEAKPQDEEQEDEEQEDEEQEDEEQEDEKQENEEQENEEKEDEKQEDEEQEDKEKEKNKKETEERDGETGDGEPDEVPQNEESQNMEPQNVETQDSGSQDENPSILQKFKSWLTGK